MIKVMKNKEHVSDNFFMYEIRVLLRDLNANAGAEGIVMERTT
jgi:hypothetical protein